MWFKSYTKNATKKFLWWSQRIGINNDCWMKNEKISRAAKLTAHGNIRCFNNVFVLSQTDNFKTKTALIKGDLWLTDVLSNLSIISREWTLGKEKLVLQKSVVNMLNHFYTLMFVYVSSWDTSFDLCNLRCYNALGVSLLKHCGTKQRDLEIISTDIN